MEMSRSAPGARVGLLGGTFNPVHTGHIRHALEVGEALRLDRVLLTPAAVPPHKGCEGLLPFALRVELARAAAGESGDAGARAVAEYGAEGAGDAGAKGGSGHGCRLGVNTLEGELDGPSYTFVSLTVWRDRHPGVTPFFLMGVEDFTQLHTWRRGLDLPGLARLVVVSRAGAERELFLAALERHWPGAVPDADAPAPGVECVRLPGGGVCSFVPVPRLDISSSLVRERWLAGRDIRGLVPDAVLRVMEERRDEIRRVWARTPY